MPALGGVCRYQVSISRSGRLQASVGARGSEGTERDDVLIRQAMRTFPLPPLSLSHTDTYEDVIPGPVRRKLPIRRLRRKVPEVCVSNRAGASSMERVTLLRSGGHEENGGV